METLHPILHHTFGVLLIATMIKASSEDKNALPDNEIDSVPRVLDTIVVNVNSEDFPVKIGDNLIRELSVIVEGYGVYFAEISRVEKSSSSDLENQVSLSKLSNTISNVSAMNKIYGMESDSETITEQFSVCFEILQTVASMETKITQRINNRIEYARPSFEDFSQWHRNQEFSRVL